MTTTVREPQIGDVAFPRGASNGTYVIVRDSHDDTVEIEHFSPYNEKSHRQSIRLSTYLSRYEWEMDAILEEEDESAISVEEEAL